MLKPFYQGKLDTFCAIYAVLNSFRLIHGIRTGKARDILNQTLMALATNPLALNAVLTQQTNYVSLVDYMLNVFGKKIPVAVSSPFAERPDAGEEEFFSACEDWLGSSEDEPSHRAVVFRFLRYMNPESQPLNRHWTTADYVRDNVLHLFDCSHEAEAILNIRRDAFVTSPARIDADRLLCIEPQTSRFLRLPF